ncbi:hypothetical protein EG329_000092 [Mollisiaceae sp. DMI_Dod_QoI]|nr:hypothetical protein EG329_000092 [Helotiales sp. DMI_Dod_QoI]
MSAARSPSITFAEPNLVRIPTGEPDVDHDEKVHAQDWTVTTDPKDSWANRERRRSTVWAKVDDVDVTANNPKRASASGAPRRGSILSIWSTGKDKHGRDALVHDDHEASDGEDESAIARDMDEKAESESGDPDLLKMLNREKRGSGAGSDRRGSILSLWSQGKDENGRAVMMHDDEEWKV